MMDESIKLPMGFLFSPFEEELITLFLKPKVLGQKLPCNLVEERQLYGPDANPWQIFDPENHSWILSEVSSGKFEKITYAFVNLTRKGIAQGKKKDKRENYTKKAGCGTWDGKTKRTDIRDRNGDLIGQRRMLSFEINEVSDQDLSKVGFWRMHEYHLCGINKDISNPRNTVLCKITLDHSKNPPVRLCSKGNQDHPIKSSNKPAKKNTDVHIVSSPSTVNIGSVECNQGVSGISKGATTQTRRDDSAVSDSYKVKEKEGCSGIENVEARDGVECVEGDIAVIASSPSEVKTGYLNPSNFDFHWPAKSDNDCKQINMQCGGGDLHFGTTKVHFSRFLKPKESSPSTVSSGSAECNQVVSGNPKGAITTQTCRDDSAVSYSYKVKEKEGCSGTENVEARDGVECVNSCCVEGDIAVFRSSPLEVKTGYLNPSIFDFHWPAKKDNDCKQIKMQSGGGDLHFGTTKVHFSRILKPEESSLSTVNRGSVECNQGVSGNSKGAITTQTRRDDSAVSDCYKVKEKEGCSGTENVEACDVVECVNSCCVEGDIAVFPSSPLEVKTGYLNPSIFDFHWPAKKDNDCKQIKMQSGGGDLHFGTTKVHFSRILKPEESSLSTVNRGSVGCNQGVSGNSKGAITTQTRRDDSAVSECYKVKEKEGCSGTENVEACDVVECVNSCCVEGDIAVIASSPSEVKTGYLNPSISDFHWPAKK